MQNHSYENDFDLHENETACRTHFHMKGFALRLVLKQRQERTRKWPITFKHQFFMFMFQFSSDHFRNRSYIVNVMHCVPFVHQSDSGTRDLLDNSQLEMLRELTFPLLYKQMRFFKFNLLREMFQMASHSQPLLPCPAM